MTPVDQSICDEGRGDCMRATVASVLDLEIIQVPHFILFDEWNTMFIGFLYLMGWEYDGVKSYWKDDNTPVQLDETFGGYTLASVPSRNYKGMTHSVVIDTTGLVVHDPSPHKNYQGENVRDSGDVLYWYMVSKKETE